MLEVAKGNVMTTTAHRVPPHAPHHPRTPAVPPPRPQGPGVGRAVAAIAASVALVLSAGFLGIGLSFRITDLFVRDSDGFLTGVAVAVHSDGHAVISESIEIRDETAVVDLPEGIVGQVKIEVNGGSRDVFVGVAPTADVESYLAEVQHSTITSVQTGGTARYRESPGAGTSPAPPARMTFWAGWASGAGRQTLIVDPRAGEWSVVVMRPDGSAPVDADVRVGATVPVLDEVAVALLVGGLVLGVAGTAVLWAAVTGPRHC